MATDDAFGKRVGGALCLDFINTVHGRVSAPSSRGAPDAESIVGERLTSYDALLRWGVLVEVLTARDARLLVAEAEQRPARRATVLRRALAVREAMYRLFKDAIERRPPRAEDLAVFNRELRIARAHERMIASSSGFSLEAERTPSAIDRVLWPVVRSAADLFTSPRLLARVGQCPGDVCGWLFLDTSRSGRRQWCDMSDCGNVAKVRRFRQKHAE